MTPEYVVGAVAFRDMISYLYSTQVSMPHLIDPNFFATSEKSIWDTYQYHGILPTYAIRFSLHPLPGSDSFTASVNGIRTPDIPNLSPDDLIWYPFASNLEDLKAVRGTLVALFNHYKATISLDTIGLYFSPGINGYALLTLTTAEGERLNFNFKLPSINTLTLKDLNQSLSKDGFDLTLSDFSDYWSDAIPYAVITPPTLSLPEWNTTTDQGTLKPSDTLSQSLLQASNLLSRSLGMFTPIPEQNSPFLTSFLTQAPAWDTPSLALTVFPESLVVNGEDYIVEPSSEDAFLSSPILSQVFGSLSCYQDTLRVLSNLRDLTDLDRIILTIPQSPSDYITLLTNRNLGDKAERYYIGLKQGVTPETLPQFIEKSWSYLYRKGVVARSSWDLKAVTNTSSEPLLQHKNPVLKGYSPAIPKFLRVLLRGFSDSLEQVEVVSPIFRDFLEKTLSSHRKKKIIEITDLPSIYTANDLYSTILQIQGYYSLHDVKEFLTGYLSDTYDPLTVSDAVLIAAFEAFFTRDKNLLFDPKHFTPEGYSREESFILLCDFLQVAPIKHAYAMIPYQLGSYEYHEGKSKLSYSEISLQGYLSHLERSIVPFTPLSFTSTEGILKDVEGIPIENLHVATYDWGTILRFPTSLPYATQGIIFNKDNLQDFEQLGDMLKDYTFYLYTGVARSRYKWLTFTDPTSLLSHFDFFVDTPRGFPENLALPAGTLPRISTILNGLKADPESFLNFLRSSPEYLGKEPASTTHPRIKEIQEFFDAP